MTVYNIINLGRKIITGLLLFLSFPVIAQETASGDSSPRSGFTKIFDYDSTTWLFIFLFFLMILIIYVLSYSLTNVLRYYDKNKNINIVEPALQKKQKVVKESLWKKIDRTILTRAVPVEHEADVMLDHNYDGIRELDNNLPPWWKWGFVVTILFAVFYLLSYHVAGTGKLQLEEYKDELAQAEKAKIERIRIAGENVNERTVAALTDEASINEGRAIFKKNCVACHLDDGGGKVGPNLTDDYWLHGGGIKNIFSTITNGVPAKGMISWKTQLSPKQIQKVASFVLTLHGTKPLVPKEPQGELWVESNDSTSNATSVATTDSTLKK